MFYHIPERPNHKLDTLETYKYFIEIRIYIHVQGGECMLGIGKVIVLYTSIMDKKKIEIC